MTEPSKHDIIAIFKRLRAIPTNKSAFFNQHGCTSSETNAKYNSRAAQLYREKIRTLANQATRQHGTELGAKKGGLGAQKVSSQSFSAQEKRAQAVDKLREESAAERAAKPEEPVVTSMRLTYQDLELQRKKDEEKLRGLEGKKKEQAERLGMGFSNRSGVSHSVLADMQTIQQENPSLAQSSSRSRKCSDDEEEEEGYFFIRTSPKYNNDEAQSSDQFFSQWDTMKKKESKKPEPEIYLSSKMSSFEDRTSTRRKADPVPLPVSDDAQKKFGSAKAISSDMFFGKQDNAEYEARTRLGRFSDSSAISSADLFDEQKKQTSSSYSLSNVLPSAPDMSQLKMGVRSVAGKLSVMASGVVSTIQVCLMLITLPVINIT
ncbi:ADP-ribosylation factor GTPase-activating protein 3 [Bagarius yarrelli]|uniref:ADP-ribosylation factor GTPase-activating protein 3 n=1 Tax=Bagarius yarrelli TaxID=175774 RepID=A0A556TH84_BAGYA|nr:ADP-ribosylation factor GTPase-activating protein 3 [Bagarius yarrelli]